MGTKARKPTKKQMAELRQFVHDLTLAVEHDGFIEIEAGIVYIGCNAPGHNKDYWDFTMPVAKAGEISTGGV